MSIALRSLWVLTLLISLGLLAPRAAAQESEKVRASDLVPGMNVEVKVKARADGAFDILDLELRDPAERATVSGLLEAVSADEVKVLGISIDLDSTTEILTIDGKPDSGKTLRAGDTVKVDLQRSSRVARRVRQLAADRRPSIAGTIQISEKYDLDTRRLVILDCELRVAERTRVDVPKELVNRATSTMISREPGQRRGIRKDEDVARGLLKLGNWGTLGGTIEWRGEDRDNFSLQKRRNRDELRSKQRTKIELTARPREDLLIVASIKGEQDDRDTRGRENLHELIVKPDETFVQMEQLWGTPISVVAGRSRFEDDREWLFNRNLDGLRVFYDRAPLALEASVTTGLDTGDMADNHTINFMSMATVDIGARSTVSGYIIDRRDQRDGDVSPFLYGLRASGRPLRQFSYWLELAGVSGVDHTRRIRGYAFDAGATWTLDLPLKPNFTLGWAMGSGDDDPTDNVDGNFRQTGLHRNNDKFAGVTSFKYYGETVDPELSNISIVTAGVGARLLKRTSIDIVAHTYFQDVAATTLRNANLRESPNGKEKWLGSALDVILGMREWEGLDVEFISGWFDPGPAFNHNQTAFTLKFQVRFRF